MAKAKDKNLTVQIIRDSLIWQYMPDPGQLSGVRLKTYDEMLDDARVGSLFEERVRATENRPVRLKPTGNSRIDEYCDKYIREKMLRKWTNQLLPGALEYGFRPAEIIWEEKGGVYSIGALIHHRIGQYRFDSEGRMYHTAFGAAPLDDQYKFIVHRIDGDRYNNPYGRSYLRRAYWPWMFKKLGFKFWLQATEKFSVPTIMAIFEQSDEQKAKATAEDLAETISRISSSSSAALANVKEIKELDMAGSLADFDCLIKACDLQITYGMTGQALANNVSDTGTQALGTVQAQTKDDVYENDARAMAYTLQALVDMCIHVNFGEDAPCPEVTLETEDKASFSDVMTAIDRGIPVSRSALYSQYGLPKPDENIEDDAFVSERRSADPFDGYDFADNLEDGKKKLRPMKRTILY